MSKLNKTIDKIEKVFIELYNKILYIFLRVVFIEIYPPEISKRKYFPEKEIFFTENDENDEDDTNILIEIAKFAFELENQRNDKLTDKAKILLSLATFSITFVIAFYSKILKNDANIVLIILYAIFIIICIILCLNFLSISTSMNPSFDKQKESDNNKIIYDLSKNGTEISFIKDLIRSEDNNSRSNDYLADIYRAAQRYYLLSFLTLTLILIIQSVAKLSGISV